MRYERPPGRDMSEVRQLPYRLLKRASVTLSVSTPCCGSLRVGARKTPLRLYPQVDVPVESWPAPGGRRSESAQALVRFRDVLYRSDQAVAPTAQGACRVGKGVRDGCVGPVCETVVQHRIEVLPTCLYPSVVRPCRSTVLTVVEHHGDPYDYRYCYNESDHGGVPPCHPTIAPRSRRSVAALCPILAAVSPFVCRKDAQIEGRADFTAPERSPYDIVVVEQPDAPVDPEIDAASTDLEIPLGIVVARIFIVSGIGVAAALAIFFLIGAIWLWGIVAAALTVLFLFLMFAIERFVE